MEQDKNLQETLDSVDKTLKAIMVLSQRHLTLREMMVEIIAIKELTQIFPAVRDKVYFRLLDILGLEEDDDGMLVKTRDQDV